MVDSYEKIVRDGILSNVDIKNITLDNIIIRWVLRDFNKPYPICFYAYSIIIENKYYVLVLKDDFYDDFLWYSEKDLITITNSNNYEIYNFNLLSWFRLEENCDEMCEMEMERIRPLIRKEKINLLFK